MVAVRVIFTFGSTWLVIDNELVIEWVDVKGSV